MSPSSEAFSELKDRGVLKTKNLVGELGEYMGSGWGDKELSKRPIPRDLSPHPKLPEDTRLWAALQSASGGTWGGCVFDVDDIVKTLEAGQAVLENN